MADDIITMMTLKKGISILFEKVSAEERKHILQTFTGKEGSRRVLSWKGKLASVLAVFGSNCKVMK